MEDFFEEDGFGEVMYQRVTSRYAANQQEALSNLSDLSPLVGDAVAEALENQDEKSVLHAVDLYARWSCQAMALIFFLNYQQDFSSTEEFEAALCFEVLTLNALAEDCIDAPHDSELLTEFACCWMSANQAYQELLAVL